MHYDTPPVKYTLKINNLQTEKKSVVQPHFLHPSFPFHPSPPQKSINKKIPLFISCFQSNFVHLYQVIRAERRNAKNPAPLLIRYLLPNFLLFTS